MSVKESSTIEDTHVHIRGDVHHLGDPVSRGFLQVASRDPAVSLPQDQSGRLQLSQWIVAPDNPLTPRVMANRVWHWLFGVGLVPTVDNFGFTGQSPTHPVLLDYLAARLVEYDWSAKRLIREIVLSETYQRSTSDSLTQRQLDPENRYLWRMNRRRLTAECLTDAILSVSGEMSLTMGASTIRDGTATDYGYRHDCRQRAVYWPVLRNSLPDIFQAFDFADPAAVTGRRDVSSVPTQALFLLNNPWVVEQSKRAAERILRARGSNPQRVELAYHLALGRGPTETERDLAVEYVDVQDEQDLATRWAQLFQALFASVDFRFVD